MVINGVIKKQVFLQEYEVPYAKASADCVARGLTVFKMDSPESISQMNAGAQTLYKTGNGGKVWVDGLNPAVCSTVDNTSGPFKQASDACTGIHYSACEKLV